MSANSEARKRWEAVNREHAVTQAERVAAKAERTREVTQAALEDVYVGAGFVEADALLLALEDRGARIEMRA